MQSDADWIKSLNTVSDPVDALRIIVENESFLGHDPYYSDLRKAMLDMAERIVETHANL